MHQRSVAVVVPGVMMNPEFEVLLSAFNMLKAYAHLNRLRQWSQMLWWSQSKAARTL
jgi:hypothetical protein